MISSVGKGKGTPKGVNNKQERVSSCPRDGHPGLARRLQLRHDDAMGQSLTVARLSQGNSVLLLLTPTALSGFSKPQLPACLGKQHHLLSFFRSPLLGLRAMSPGYPLPSNEELMETPGPHLAMLKGSCSTKDRTWAKQVS